MTESKLERNFWRFWLAGLLILAAMIVANVWLMTGVAPGGISDHQAAGTAARVDAIQQSWEAGGVLGLARISMVADLIFIGIYSFGAAAGGLFFIRKRKRSLRSLGALVLAGAAVFCLTDYVETICQFIQIMRMAGDDRLAGIAAAVLPAKSIAFLVTFFGLILALFINRMAKRRA